jgi:hypothetical protein
MRKNAGLEVVSSKVVGLASGKVCKLYNSPH